MIKHYQTRQRRLTGNRLELLCPYWTCEFCFVEYFFNLLWWKANDSKLRIYLQFKNNYIKEVYLDYIQSSSLRKAVTKLRISDHSLPIKLGRRKNTSIKNIICNKCKINKIGNEYHFITECDNTIIFKFWNDVLKSISAVMPQFTKLQIKMKVNFFILCFAVIKI